MKNKLCFFILLLISVPLHSQYTFQKIASYSYGSKENEIGIRKEAEGTYGPAGFIIDKNNIYILDAENAKIKTISLEGKLRKNITVKPLLQSLAFSNGFLVMQDNNGILMAIDPNTNEIIKDYSSPPLTNTSFIKKINSSKAKFTSLLSSNSVSFEIIENTAKLASISFIGMDNEYSFYFNEEVFVSEIPLIINRYILKYSLSGELRLKLKLPDIYYCRLDKDIEVTPDGDIYHLLANKNELEIICWKYDRNTKSEIILFYPAGYQGRYHYNNEIQNENKILPYQPLNILPSEKNILVEREESLQIADTYVNHVWTCEQKNLTLGIVRASDGKDVQTPDWIKIGANTKIPYKWGGFSTLIDFDKGLTGGKYAGDNICTGGGSSAAVGVDCSGFVSRCWKLSSHYSTSMMPSIMVPHNSWADLRKGDAIHRVGHVRMSVENNPNGTVYLVESSGKDWRVSYRTYGFNDLTGYLPYRYKNMVEGATSVNQNDILEKFYLYNNYPNPFNPSTIINFRIPVYCKVQLKIYDILGRDIITLLDEYKQPGTYNMTFSTKRLNFNKDLPSGVYLYSLKAGSFIQTRKMILAK